MKKAWWKEAVMYQIYPRSFLDTNGDGIGDLNGITLKLDYIKELGVDVIWLSPVYKSPNDDNGYDISDYYSIMDEFGNLQDWERLLEGVHTRGMRLIMDLVVNHTSDEHPWFIESASSKDNDKRDFYIWRDPRDGHEPNNWGSFFSPSAWEFDKATGQYYLHLFSKKQPDLNWKNPKVRHEIFEMMKWWLDKGIDGFRMDVINAISKAEGLPDASTDICGSDRYKLDISLYFNQPGIHKLIEEMNREVLSRYDIVTVGETLNVTPADGLLYTGADRNELNMIIQFELMDIDSGPGGKWDIRDWTLYELKKIVSKWQTELDDKGWISLYLNNHDQPRMVSRFGNDKNYRVESAKMLATLLHTLQGTPFIYQGEEIGMTNVRFDSIDKYRDIETLNFYNQSCESDKGEKAKAMNIIYKKGRDNARTPMQWNSNKNAGFTAGIPWIGLNPNYKFINVEQALTDKNSIFYYYKHLIGLRRTYPVIVYGDYSPVLEEHTEIFSYVRRLGDEMLLVVLNFYAGSPLFELPEDIKYGKSKLLISNYDVNPDEMPDKIILRPYESRVYLLSQAD